MEDITVNNKIITSNIIMICKVVKMFCFLTLTINNSMGLISISTLKGISCYPDYNINCKYAHLEHKEPGEQHNPPQNTIDNDNQNPLTINFYGSITTDSCLALTSMLRQLDIKSKELEIQYDYKMPIKLHIQSMGGELMPTFYVCDLIQKMDTPVHVYIDGYVASAAATIAVCGDKRYITKHSSMLIHQLKSSSSGKFAELQDEMSNLNMFMMNLEDLYLENTKIEKDVLEKLLFSEIWLPSDKCLEFGLVDAII
jgi:ATP-dependent protease ClpP protease subunit|tara:strand:+ start:230 stop:994 length:765 start_codon:yes stop_codon:yes gene_type:complete